MTKPFWFTLPESFDPREFLRTKELRRRADDANYFISLILWKLAHRIVDDRGLVRLRAEHLRNVMSFRDYSDVIDALREGGAVERFAYSVGQRPFGFRLAERFATDKHKRVAATDPRLIRRLALFREQLTAESQARMKPVHHALAKQQCRLRIHGDTAREILSGLPPKSNRFDIQGVLIGNIENHEFHCSVGQYGRLANNITNMKRELRSALHVSGDDLVGVDISCAQPALLAKIIRDTNETSREAGRAGNEGEGNKTRCNYDVQKPEVSVQNIINDVADYQRLVQSGTLYQCLQSELDRAGIAMTEKKLKRKFLRDVVAKKKILRKADGRSFEYPSEVENIFRRLFPTVYQFVREFNRNGWEHANLIRELQRQESAFVLETAAADLVSQYPQTFFITLHDAIYSTEQHIPKIVAAFEAAFEKFDFRMSWKLTSQTGVLV